MNFGESGAHLDEWALDTSRIRRIDLLSQFHQPM